MIRLTTICVLLLAMSIPLMAQTSLIIPTSHKIDLADLKAPEFDTKKEKRKAKRALKKLKKEEAVKAQQKWERDYAALERQVSGEAELLEQEVYQQLPDTALISQFLDQHRLDELDSMSYEDFEEQVKTRSEDQVDKLIATGEAYVTDEILEQDIPGRVEAAAAPYRAEYDWLRAEHTKYKSMVPDSTEVGEQLQDSILMARLDRYMQEGESRLVARSGLGDMEGELSTSYDGLYEDLYPIDMRETSEFDAFAPLDYQRYLEQIRGLAPMEDVSSVLNESPTEISEAMVDRAIEQHAPDPNSLLQELVDQHSDEMEQKTFAERSGISGYLELRRGEPTALDAAPNFYYQVTGKVTLGVGLDYRFFFGARDSLATRADQSGRLGMRAYMEYQLPMMLYLHLEYEHNDYRVGQDFESTDFPSTADEHYVGIGRDFGLKGRWRTSFLLLYNLSQDDFSPNRNRWTVRWGFKM